MFQSPLFRLKDILLDMMVDNKKYLLGRVLTIIDASIQDTEQRKALKDIIQEAFWDSSNNTWILRNSLYQFADKFCHDQMPKTVEEKNNFLEKGLSSGEVQSLQDFFPDTK
jgi:uncharacterized membrane protein YgaE (UPF0421/DUF939 family)